ncbi:MAG TPA: helicase-associated domain-containing protein, partial [Herpetosiphonaceae bacterium]|nr:helicase-associated domain-containing protein [Herpetosiphonaceae bacterium]
GWPWVAVFRVLALEAALLTRGGDGVLHLSREATGWLRLPRPERLAALFRAWRRAASLDELALFAGLNWRSQPFALRLPESRATLVELLASLPPGEWLPVEAIVAEIERVEPDFLRRDGRYDRWLVYDEHGQLLTGRDSWGRIEGTFIRAALWRTLHWLGLVDLGCTEVLDTIRLTPLAAHVLQGAPAPVEPAPEPISVQGTFEVICPPGASLYARFQLGRIADRVSDDAAAVFRLTRPSIVRAGENGIGVEDVLRFLEEHGRAPVPQAVAAYIREWAGHVGRLRLEEAALLRADDPLRLVELRKVRGVTLPPVEELTPTTWKLPPGDVGSLVQQLDKAGFGVEGGAAARGPAAKTSARPISDHDLRALVTAAYAYATACAELGLPCEVSDAMLMRLSKLVPSRQFDAAYRAAQTLRASIGERHAGARNTREGDSDA